MTRIILTLGIGWLAPACLMAFAWYKIRKAQKGFEWAMTGHVETDRGEIVSAVMGAIKHAGTVELINGPLGILYVFVHSPKPVEDPSKILFAIGHLVDITKVQLRVSHDGGPGHKGDNWNAKG